jgi:hypothetical protein
MPNVAACRKTYPSIDEVTWYCGEVVVEQTPLAS